MSQSTSDSKNDDEPRVQASPPRKPTSKDDPVYYDERQLVCSPNTCSFCGKFNTLCSELDKEMIEDWTKETNPFLCQECDDLCWVHERPVINTPLKACVCYK